MIDILIWLVFGALAGWVASIIMGTNDSQGVVGNIAVGLIGALIGGFVMRSIGGEGITGFNFPSFLIAVLGSIVLLFIFHFVKKGRSTQ